MNKMTERKARRRAQERAVTASHCEELRQSLARGQTFAALCQHSEERKKLHKLADSLEGVSHLTADGNVFRAWHRSKAILAVFQALSTLPEGVCRRVVQQHIADDRALRGAHDDRVSGRKQDRQARKQAKRERMQARTRECDGCGEYTGHLVSVYCDGCYCDDCIAADEELDSHKWESIRAVLLKPTSARNETDPLLTNSLDTFCAVTVLFKVLQRLQSPASTAFLNAADGSLSQPEGRRRLPCLGALTKPPLPASETSTVSPKFRSLTLSACTLAENSEGPGGCALPYLLIRTCYTGLVAAAAAATAPRLGVMHI